MIALLRTELVKAARRGRTLVIAGLLVGLPLLIVSAIRSRGQDPERRSGPGGLFTLAERSGLLVPAPVLGVTSGFLLIVVVGLFAGDAVAGDASWGNLRYVLLRPVGRVRLLVAKALVATFLTWACVFLLAAVSLGLGVLAFGAHPLEVPTYLTPQGLVAGYTLSESEILLRILVITAYVAFGYTALLAIGIFASTVTDSPASAAGAAIGTYIVSAILNGIPELGRLRYGLPTRYLNSWRPMLTRDAFPHDMLVGVGVQVAYLVVFAAAAVWWFRRKDVHA